MCNINYIIDEENTKFVVWILRIETTSNNQKEWCVASIDVTPHVGAPSDLSFYNAESIAILRENADGNMMKRRKDGIINTIIGDSALFELYEYSSLTYIPIDLSSLPSTICSYLQVPFYIPFFLLSSPNKCAGLVAIQRTSGTCQISFCILYIIIISLFS